jgi:hypothetical protein
MILRRAISVTRAIARGWALTIETFFGPQMATSVASAIWAQKSLRYINIGTGTVRGGEAGTEVQTFLPTGTGGTYLLK